jgi:hypothetical protein
MEGIDLVRLVDNGLNRRLHVALRHGVLCVREERRVGSKTALCTRKNSVPGVGSFRPMS